MAGRTFQEIDAAKNKTAISAVQSGVQNLPPGYIQGYLATVADTKTVNIGAGICEVAGHAVRISSTTRLPTSAFGSLPILPSTSYHVFIDSNGKLYVFLTAPLWNDTYLAYYHSLYVYRYIATIETNASGEFYFIKRYTADTTTDINADNVKAQDFVFQGSVASQTALAPANGANRSILTDSGIEFDQYNSAQALWLELAKLGPGVAANLADLIVTGRVYANDTLLAAIGRFWSTPTSIGSGIEPTNVAFGQNGVGLLCDYASQDVYRTSDGATWGSVATGFSSPYIANSVATNAAGKWIVVSQGALALVHIAYSSDNGASFADLGSKVITSNYPEVTYANGKWIVAMLNSRYAYIATDPSAIGNFVSVELDTTYSCNGRPTYVGNNTWYVPLSTVGKYSLSNDNGATWTTHTTAAFTGALRSSSYGNGTLCVGTDAGEVGYSIDSGVTFSVGTSPFGGSDDIDRMSFGAGIFVAMVGATGETARSLDLGKTWGVRYGDLSSTSPIGATSGAGLCFTSFYGKNGRFYVCGWVSTYGYVGYSDYIEPNFGASYSGQENTDLTGVTQDYTPKVGETCQINFTSATSVPLHIATGDGTEYEMTISDSVGYNGYC